MTRIDPPAFAPDFVLREEVRFYDGITLRQYQRAQSHRDAMFAAAHAAVEAYLDECALDQPELFPYRAALTGEYYLERREGYGLAGTPRRVSVMLVARCLGVRPQRSAVPADYCGIDMTLLFHPDGDRFETFYTGHQVI
jgi:hypothetical protein